MNKSNKLRLGCGAIVALLCASAIAQASETVVVGPVEQFLSKDASVTVLGQTFILTGRQAATYVSQTTANSNASGTYVLARGEARADGRLIARSITILDASYVPGATPVFIRGTVDYYDSSLGILNVDGVNCLTSDALASGSLSFKKGEVVDVVGTQAIAAGLVWANAVVRSASGRHISIDAIVGTGIQSQAIVGTGASAEAIVGTGSATNAIAGTGKQIQAIVGTGKQPRAIVGTGPAAQAIVGTGASAQAIVGTGKRTEAIVGTGASVHAIVGTGKQTQAIVGTGASAQAIVGTGRQTEAIVGTGASVHAIVGTGKQTQAIVGTGASVQAIVGTGR